MNYFTSGIHGDLNLYKELKKMAASDPDNHLWIVGDILDGNTSHPEYGMEILKDIYRTPNVSLILGDHEYAHAPCLRTILPEQRSGKTSCFPLWRYPENRSWTFWMDSQKAIWRILPEC